MRSGGIGRYCGAHELPPRHTKAPTSIQPIGLLANSKKRRINLKDTALPKLVSLFPHPIRSRSSAQPRNAGKTTILIARFVV